MEMGRDSCSDKGRQVAMTSSTCSNTPPPICGSWEGRVGSSQTLLDLEQEAKELRFYLPGSETALNLYVLFIQRVLVSHVTCKALS